MTVRELIEHLRGYNPNLPVRIIYLPRGSADAEYWPVVGSVVCDTDDLGVFIGLDVDDEQ